MLLLLLPTLYRGGKLAPTRRTRRESNLKGKRKDGTTDPTEGKGSNLEGKRKDGTNNLEGRRKDGTTRRMWHYHRHPTECGARRNAATRRHQPPPPPHNTRWGKNGTRRHRPTTAQPPPSYDPTKCGDPMKLTSGVPPIVELYGRYPLLFDINQGYCVLGKYNLLSLILIHQIHHILWGQ